MGGRIASQVAAGDTGKGTPEELCPILEPLKPRTELNVVQGGDHSFKVLKSAGVQQGDVYRGIQERIATWLRGIAET